MDVNALTQLVSSLGFPIVMCGALFWKLTKQDALHKEETTKLTEALNNNTLVMQRIVDKLGGIDSE